MELVTSTPSYNEPYTLVTTSTPHVKDNELLVKVHAAGFCHSDLQVYHGQFKSKLPIIPSHEPAGVVAQVGAKCSGSWKVGDLVGVLNFKKACTQCTGCLLSKKRYNGTFDPRYCEKREMAGFKNDGCLAEYMVADPATTIMLPDGLSFDQAAPLMCAGATVWGALEKATKDLEPGATVAIIGIGGLGYLGLQFAKSMGFRTIAIDNHDAGRTLATDVPRQSLSPDLVVDSSDPSSIDEIFKFTQNEGVAAAVVCTDSISVTDWTLSLLRIGGTMVVLGLPHEKWQFDATLLVFRELTIKGSYVASAESTRRMMEAVGKGGIRDNPVKTGDAEKLLQKHLGVGLEAKDSGDFDLLLAAVHDCAEHISALPDYQPIPDEKRYPRLDVHRATPEEQEFGNEWAHKFLIKGKSNGAGTLKGKSVCLKDCIAVAGVPQFFGSDAFPAWTPSTDATVVTRVLDEGADIVGTSVCENFCNSTSSFTSAQGIVENPHGVGYSAGGSTSGGAALVASGRVTCAIGSDQGGSIRVPSALCGCVGLKPTHGLIPWTGITSGDAVDDHAGPLTRSVLDAATFLDAMAGYDGIDDRALGAGAHGSHGFADSLRQEASLAGVKIGILREGFDQPIIDSSVRDIVLSAVSKFEQLGAAVQEVSIPSHLEGPSIWTIQQRIAGAMNIIGQAHGRRGLYLTEFEHARLPWTTENFAKLFPSTKNTVINGLYLMDHFPGLYGKTMNLSRKIRDDYEKAFQEFDVLVMPTTPVVAPKHGDPKGTPRECFEPSIGLTSNTAVFNVTGHPAISIPVGFAPATEDPTVQLPVGMQIVGGLWQEKKIFKVGHAWERDFDWRALPFSAENEGMGETSKIDACAKL
ncbi:amidase [Fusarium albosuccineum]|uniref:Amidase n=1 Tax=Fusarium albosuccineum TaxID=1237068 RepID=A0A8H4L2B4_9HYPO|nr:amidase [Fusarium albosuccineum]